MTGLLILRVRSARARASSLVTTRTTCPRHTVVVIDRILSTYSPTGPKGAFTNEPPSRLPSRVSEYWCSRLNCYGSIFYYGDRASVICKLADQASVFLAISPPHSISCSLIGYDYISNLVVLIG